MIWLTVEQTVSLHSDVVGATIGLDGVRSMDGLQSALMAPLHTCDGVDLFPTLTDKMARLACGLSQNHPFLDGNKRISAHAMLVTLKLNGISLLYSQKELSATFWKLASGELTYEQLKEWIEGHIQK